VKYRLALIGLGTSALTLFTACGNGPPPDSGTGGGSTGGGGGVAAATGGPAATTVKESDDQKFTPNSVSVKVGDTVEWTNGGTIGHNVTFDAGPKTDIMSGGDNAFFKFTTAGSYVYHCTIHPGMDGTVSVS
jgi:plastocyanin